MAAAVSVIWPCVRKSPRVPLDPQLSQVSLEEEPGLRHNLIGCFLFRQGPPTTDPDAAQAPPLGCLHLALVHGPLGAVDHIGACRYLQVMTEGRPLTTLNRLREND